MDKKVYEEFLIQSKPDYSGEKIFQGMIEAISEPYPDEPNAFMDICTRHQKLAQAIKIKKIKQY